MTSWIKISENNKANIWQNLLTEDVVIKLISHYTLYSGLMTRGYAHIELTANV